MLNPKYKFFLPVLLFGGMVIMFAIGLQRDPSEIPSTFIDKPAPAFDLPQLLNADKRLTQETLLGQVSLLNVWGSWCAGCASEHELLMSIAFESGVPIYGLNWKDERDAAINWLSQLGNPYTAIGVDQDNVIGIEYGVYGAPETFLIDTSGVIRHKHIGPLTRAVWEADFVPRIDELLRGSSS
jgi:cytochrome c biogenesis protein CcmG/thiol:disulfide interchange protein DsbE